jgi:hypothetical protein
MSKHIIGKFRNFGKTNMLMLFMHYQKWHVDLFSPKGLLIIRGKR